MIKLIYFKVFKYLQSEKCLYMYHIQLANIVTLFYAKIIKGRKMLKLKGTSRLEIVSYLQMVLSSM